MPQLVFIHGPGAGSCSGAYHYQRRHFPGCVAPDLPGHGEGTSCPDIKGYAEWLRGWLWAKGMNKDLVLVGYTMGASIALQYALDYPDEVKGIVAMTVAMHPKKRPQGGDALRMRAAKDPAAFEQWLAAQDHSMMFVEPTLKAKFIENHRRIGPASQLHDLQNMDRFDVSERIATFKPRLLLIRGLDDPIQPPDYEKEIHDAVPGSRYVRLSGTGHFPQAEQPAEVNRLIEEFVAGL